MKTITANGKDKLSILSQYGELDWDHAKEKIEEYLQSENYKSSQLESWSRISSSVPDKAREGFYECLRIATNAPFYIAVTAETDNSATFQINFRPRGGKATTVRDSYVLGGYVPDSSKKEISPRTFLRKGAVIEANKERNILVYRDKKGTPITVYLELTDNSSEVAYSSVQAPTRIIDISSQLGNCDIKQAGYQSNALGNAAWSQQGNSLIGRMGNGLVNQVRVCKIVFPEGKEASKAIVRFGGARGTLDVKSNPKANWGTSSFAWISIFEEPPKEDLRIWGRPGFNPAPQWSIELSAQDGICQCEAPADIYTLNFSKPRNEVTVLLHLHDPWAGQSEIVTVPYFTIEPLEN